MSAYSRQATPYQQTLSSLHLLNAPKMKDVTRIPAAVGPSCSLARTRSLQHPPGHFRSQLPYYRSIRKAVEDTSISPKEEKSEEEASVKPKAEAPTFPAVKVKNEFPSPLPIAVKLARSATMRETSTSAVPPSEAGARKESNRNVINGIRQRYLQRSESLKHQHSLVNQTALTTSMELVERQIQLKVKNLPSFTIQQSNGANFVPEWNWLKQLRLISAGKDTNPHETLSEMNNLLFNIRKASSIIDQIRLDFDYGLMPLSEGNESSGELMAKIDLFQSGDWARKIMLKSFQPYIPEIMKNEMKKQEKYAKWMKNSLHSPTDRKRRGEVVKWVCQTTLTLDYSAETTHLAVFLVDAWLSGRGNAMAPKTWMLLAVAAVLLAGKMEEPEACRIGHIIHLSGEFLPRKDVLYMENLLIEYMNFHLNPPLAPILVQLELMGGSMSFPCACSKKLVWDLALGILMKSLSSYTLAQVPPSEKAQVALEIATDFVLFKYKLFRQKDFERYDCATNEPGKFVGEFFVDMCWKMFQQRFMPKVSLTSMTGRTRIPSACAATPSPVKGVRG